MKTYQVDHLTSQGYGLLIFPRFNGHQYLTDKVSNAKIHKAKKDLAVLK